MYDNVENIFFEADSLISQDKIIEGKELLFEILESAPDYAKAHNHLGWIYHYKMVDFDKAETHYKLAIKYSKNYHSPFSNYAYFLIDNCAYEEMIEFGKDALQKSFVDKGIIYNQMAKAFELTSRLVLAYEFYKKAKMQTMGANFIQEMNASLYRVRDKMTIFQKIKLFFY